MQKVVSPIWYVVHNMLCTMTLVLSCQQECGWCTGADELQLPV